MKKNATSGLPKLENSAAKPFVEYLGKQIEAETEIIKVLDLLIKISEDVQNANKEIQSALEAGAGEENLQTFVSNYKEFSKDLAEWVTKQKANINAYNGESEKMTIQKDTTKKLMERNMYVQIIADQFKGDLENGDNWQLLCDSHKVFRPRLLATGMIRSTDFIDNMGYDYEWQAELKYLYDQKEIAVF